MVSIFGGGFENLSGPPGPAGSDGLDFSLFLPKTLLAGLRKYDQQNTFVLQSPENVKIERKNVVEEWINFRSGGSNFILVKDKTASSLLHLHNKYFLSFPGIYHIKGNFFPTKSSKFGYLCCTLRTKSERAQVLISNVHRFQDPQKVFIQLSVNRNNFSIWSYRNQAIVPEVIFLDLSEFKTIFIQWEIQDKRTKYSYKIGKITGTFFFDLPQDRPYLGGYYLGANPDFNQKFLGDVSAIESYECTQQIPTAVVNIIISAQS